MLTVGCLGWVSRPHATLVRRVASATKHAPSPMAPNVAARLISYLRREAPRAPITPRVQLQCIYNPILSTTCLVSITFISLFFILFFIFNTGQVLFFRCHGCLNRRLFQARERGGGKGADRLHHRLGRRIGFASWRKDGCHTTAPGTGRQRCTRRRSRGLALRPRRVVHRVLQLRLDQQCVASLNRSLLFCGIASIY